MSHISHRDHINAFMGKRTTVQLPVDEEKAERIARLLAADKHREHNCLPTQESTQLDERRQAVAAS